MKHLTKLMVMGVFLMGLSGWAMAQADAAQGMQQQQQVEMNFSDTELQKFVAVQPALENIREDYTGRLDAAADQEEANQLQQEAGQLMVDAVMDEGLDVDTYNNIAMALQADPELRDRVEQMMN